MTSYSVSFGGIPPPLTVLQALQHLDAPRLLAYLLMLVFLCAPVMRAVWEEGGASGPLTRGAAALVQRLSPKVTPLAWYVALVLLIGAGWHAVLLGDEFGGIASLYRLRLWQMLTISYGAHLWPMLGGLVAGALLLCVPRLTRVPGVLLFVAPAMVAPVIPLLGLHYAPDLSALLVWGMLSILTLAVPVIMGYFLLREARVLRAKDVEEPVTI